MLLELEQTPEVHSHHSHHSQLLYSIVENQFLLSTSILKREDIQESNVSLQRKEFKS